MPFEHPRSFRTSSAVPSGSTLRISPDPVTKLYPLEKLASTRLWGILIGASRKESPLRITATIIESRIDVLGLQVVSERLGDSAADFVLFLDNV